jgi:Type IV secretion system pilin
MYRVLVRFAGLGVALAANLAESATGPVVVAVKTLPQVIGSLTAWIVGIAFAVATLFATIAGLLYLTAGGDPAQVERAKTAFKSAVVGYGIALLAPVLLTIAKDILGG